MKPASVALMAGVLFVILMAGCVAPEPVTPAPSPSPTPTQTPPRLPFPTLTPTPKPGLAATGPQVASVNGIGIAVADYVKTVRFYWFQQGGQAGPDPLQDGQQVLDQMVDDQVILQQAARRSLAATDAEVQQAIEQSFGYYAPQPTAAPGAGTTPGAAVAATAAPSPAATSVTKLSFQSQFGEYLTALQLQTGMTEADFRAYVRQSLLEKKLYAVVTGNVPTVGTEVHARHILVSVVTPAPPSTPVPAGGPAPTATPQPVAGGPTPQPIRAPRTAAEALARAQDIKRQLDGGADFATLAAQYSDDPRTAQLGGDLGWFGHGQTVAELETAVFSMTLGTVSDPIKTVFGYHVVQVLERDLNHPLDPSALQQSKFDVWTIWLAQQRQADRIVRTWRPEMVPPTPAAPGQ